MTSWDGYCLHIELHLIHLQVRPPFHCCIIKILGFLWVWTYQLAKSLPVQESHHAKELFKELKHAKQHKSALWRPSRVGSVTMTRGAPIKRADLVMMKVELKFWFNYSYLGPYRMLDDTPANAIIQKVNDSNSEKLNVSLQWLSNTNQKNYHGWVILQLSRRRRQIKRKLKSTNQLPVNETDTQQSTGVTSTVTRREWVVHPPVWFI